MSATVKFYNRRYLNALLAITGITLSTTWLPFLRGIMDGETYTWGTTFLDKTFSGNGTSGDFYFVVINLAVGLLLLYSFYWVRLRVIFYLILILWYGAMIANVFFEAFFGEGYFLHGDTMNIHVNLSYVILPVMLLMGILVVKVIRTDRKYSLKPEWTSRNTIWALVLLAPLLMQAYLLREGEPHGTTDKIGVVLALLQVVFSSMPFRGYKLRGV